MKGVNKQILIGNLGADPELKMLPSGTAVCNLSVATSDSFKDKNGNKVDKTEWHKVTIYGKLAEIIAEYAKKGTAVYIEGVTRHRRWKDAAGVDKFGTEVEVGMNGVAQLLDPPPGSAPRQQPQQNYQPQQSYQPQNHQPQQPAYQNGNGQSTFDDDIPFKQEAA